MADTLTKDEYYTAPTDDIEDIRGRLERVAREFCDLTPGGSWSWDETKMSLTVCHRDHTPIVTLHVENVQ